MLIKEQQCCVVSIMGMGGRVDWGKRPLLKSSEIVVMKRPSLSQILAMIRQVIVYQD